MTEADQLGLPAGAFAKQDMSSDLTFYGPARLVSHIDAAAISALTAFYRTRLPEGGRILDLMSSWVSHLPDDRAFAEVVGHGMNAEELAANPRLDRAFVRDLNTAPTLPEPDGHFDAVLICVGVQYLQQPLAVIGEVHRVLRPGGQLIVSFSNRCFPTKAVAIWQAVGLRGQAELVSLYLSHCGFTDIKPHVLADGRAGDPLIAVTGRA